MSGSNQAIFLSYASQDKEAAKRICEALRAAGLEVWFDVSELRGGDAWDAKIRKQIKDCALFVPIISATTNSRPEGYFRLEWKLAVDRSHLLADDHPFLFPIAIGDVNDATARVPDKFREVQWTRLRLDETPAELAARIQRLLSGEGGTSSREAGSTASREPSPPGKKKKKDDRPAWLKHAWSLVGLAFVVYYMLLNPILTRCSPKPPKTDKPGAESRAEGGKEDQAEKLEKATQAMAKLGQLMDSAKSAAAGQAAAQPAIPVADKSVAVLAFANLSDDKSNEYFSDGISEELLNVLAKIPELKVAARTSAFYFKGKEVAVPEIARQLGVAYVVEGSVRKAGDKVRITAQLIKASDGFHVWSDTFTRDLKDIFGVQDEIARVIAQNLELRMGFTAAKAGISSDAYQEYLLGRAAASRASMKDMREAVGHFEKAVALEPKYTSAWVQLAIAHTQLGRWGGGGGTTLQCWQSARAAIDRARALEPDSPDVLVALGWILRTGEWKWREAERVFRRALELRPNQPEVLAGAAVLFYNMGRTEEGFRLGEQSLRLDPLNPANQIDLSIMFFFADKPIEAERTARRALQLAPNGASFHAILAWSLISQKRYAEAEAEIALEKDPVEQPTAYGLLAIARGQPDVTREMIERLRQVAGTNPDAADLQQSISWLYATLGEKDLAFAGLEKARDSRDPSMAWLRNSPYLRLLADDPRWDKLLHEVGLADDQLK